MMGDGWVKAKEEGEFEFHPPPPQPRYRFTIPGRTYVLTGKEKIPPYMNDFLEETEKRFDKQFALSDD